MKILIMIFLISFYSCSSVVYKTKTKNFSNDINSMKRISIQISEKNISEKSKLLLYDILKQEVSHRTLFIVYSEKDKSKKKEGIFFVEANEKLIGNKIELSFIGHFVDTKTNLSLWHYKLKKSFDLDSKENLSVSETYAEKYGSEIKSKVNPYFELSKNLIENLDGPKSLSEDEELEKIEIESN
jgi:probable lipoprotein (TIGR04455 family)